MMMMTTTMTLTRKKTIMMIWAGARRRSYGANIEAEGGESDFSSIHQRTLLELSLKMNVKINIEILKPKMARAMFQAFINEPSWSCP